MERYLWRGMEDRREIYSSAEDVWLRSFTPDDADTVVELINHDQNHFYRTGEGVTVEKYQKPEDFRRSLDEPGDRVRFGIWASAASDRELVGSINYESVGNHAVIGYWVGAEHVGHRYAGRALRTLVQHLLSEGYQDIYADARVDNEGSLRTLESSGFIASSGVDERGYIEYKYWPPAEH